MHGSARAQRACASHVLIELLSTRNAVHDGNSSLLVNSTPFPLNYL